MKNKPLKRIVDPRNARSKPYAAELRKIQKSGLCPFCPGGKTLVEGKDPILLRNDHWLAIQSHTPIANTQHHWVVFPKKHRTRVTQLSNEEWCFFSEIISTLQKKFKVAGDVVSFTAREGDTVITGATVLHLHFNIYVPKRGRVVTVTFGRVQNKS